MAIAYYYRRDDQQFGPVSVEQLKELGASGQLQAIDLIQKEGTADWIPAARFKGLIPSPPDEEDYSVAPPHPKPEIPPFVPPVPPPVADGEEPHDTTQAEIAARQAKEAALAASTDALKAVKVMMKNPVGGLREAFESLGEARAMAAGIVFGVVFALCVFIGEGLIISRVLAATHAMFQQNGTPTESVGIGFFGYIRLLTTGFIPPAVATGCFAASRKLFHGRGTIQSDLFAAGAALLPCGLAVLLAGLLGMGNLEISGIIGVFAMTTTVLMLYSGCTTMQGLSEPIATLAVPIMVVADLLASKIILASMG